MEVSWCTCSKHDKFQLSERFKATGCIMDSKRSCGSTW